MSFALVIAAAALLPPTARSQNPSVELDPPTIISPLKTADPGQRLALHRRTIEARPQTREAGDYYFTSDGTRIQLLRALPEVALFLSADADPSRVIEAASHQTPVRPLKGDGATGRSRGRLWSLVEAVPPGTAVNPAALENVGGVVAVRPVLIDPMSGVRMVASGDVIVRLAPSVAPGDLQALLDEAGLDILEPIGPARLRSYLLRPRDPAADPMPITRDLAARAGIEWAAPNFLRQLRRHFTPNDPLYPRQQHLHNTGQQGAVADADIDAPEAWDISQGSSSIVIAILDDGVDTGHADLNIFQNLGEIGGGKENNGIDDDGNGFIDDYRGWDFADHDNNPNPVGSNGHGTASAGVAAAILNNATRVAGIAGQCRILAVKIFSNAGDWATDADIAAAISYAGQMADVLSIGWTAGAPSPMIDAALTDVFTNGRSGFGCPIFASSGNDASPWRQFVFPVGPDLGPGTYSFGFRYTKDFSTSTAEDLIKIDNVVLLGGNGYTHIPSALGPGGRQDFEGAFPPPGWSLSSSSGANWFSTLIGAFLGTAGTRSARSGAISHNQWTELRTPNVVLTGDERLVAQVYLSSERDFDGLELRPYDAMGNPVGAEPYFFLSGFSTVVTAVAYPARHPHTIAVGASTDVDRRADYSQYGPELDFLAPSSGGWNGITTLDPTGAVGYSTSDFVTSFDMTAFGKTSSAAPLAAGVAALLLSVNPALTATQVRDTLRQTADKIGPLAYVNGFNPEYGYGRINARAALQSMGATTIMVVASDDTASESPGNTGRFTVSRTGSTASSLNVSLVVGGTATSGSDYTAIPTSVTFGAGVSITNITVTPINDSLQEERETVMLSIAPGANYTVGQASTASVVIYDNDGVGPCPPGVLRLDGVNDFATAVGSVWPSGSSLVNYTIEAWIYPRSTSGVRYISADDAFDLDFTTGGVVHAAYGPFGTFSQTSTALAPIPNQWNHVAITFNQSTRQMRVALNGVFGSSTTFNDTAFYSDNAQRFTLGARRLSPKAAPEGLFHGEIDEVRISSNIRYTSNFVPPLRFEPDANTRALYHFDEPAGATTFADSSGNGHILTGVGGAQAAALPGPEGPNTGPVAHWKFDETIGTTAVDATGNGNEGALSNGPVWDPAGAVGGALFFDGVNDIVTVPNSPDLEVGRNNTDFTVAFWMKLQEGPVPFWRVLLHKGETAETRTFSFYFAPNSDRLTCRISLVGKPSAGLDSLRPIPTNKWTHVALTKTGATLQLYLNGTLDRQVTLSSPVLHNQGPLHIGNNPWTAGTRTLLDDLRIYCRTLSQSEICRITGPVGHWRFAEGPGLVARDSSPYGNDAILGSGSTTPAWTPERDGVLSFDGINDIAVVANSPELEVGKGNSDFAVAFWINLQEGPTPSWRVLLHKGENAETRTFSFFFAPNSNRLVCRLSLMGQPSIGVDSTSPIPLNAWTHVTLLKSASKLSLYINGILDRQITLSHPVLHNSGPLHIGDSPWALGTRALLDDLRIYCRAISDLEIYDLARLVGHWRFAEGSGSVARDASAYGNNMLLDTGASAPAWVPNGADSALAFDGVNDIATVPNAPELELGKDNADFTVCFRMNLKQALLGGWRVLLHKAESPETRTFAFYFAPNSSKLVCRVSLVGQPNAGLDSVAAISPNVWTHIALVKAGLQLRLYLNGTLDRQISLSAPVLHNQGPIYVGANPWIPGTQADLDELRLYHSALPASMIADLAESHAMHAVTAASDNVESHPVLPEPLRPIALHGNTGDTDSELTADPFNLPARLSLEQGSIVLRLPLDSIESTADWQIDVSDDLVHWSPAPAELSQTIVAHGDELTLEIRLSIDGITQRFIRWQHAIEGATP